MLRYLSQRVAPLAITLALFLVLLFGGAYWAYSQVVLYPGGNPSAIQFPGPFWLVFGVSGAVSSGSSTMTGGAGYPSGTCAVGAATTTGHNTLAFWATPSTPSGGAAGTVMAVQVASISGGGVTFTVTQNPAVVYWAAICN